MSTEDDLRLAWQADRDGRPGRRDALLTLAAAQAPSEARWLSRCRARLIERHPDHLFARFSSIAEARAHPKVAYALEQLRELYPPGKVANLVRRDEVRRGHWTGDRPPLSVVLDDLFGNRARRQLGHSVPVRREPRRSASPSRVAVMTSEAHSRIRFTLGVLWTIAILHEVIRREHEPGTKQSTRAA